MIAAVSIAGISLFTPLTAFAQSTTTPLTPSTMDLHPTKVIPKATGAVTVKAAGAGQFAIHVDAHGLPKPSLAR